MLINLRNALMAGKRLPYDAEVEYLESTGTQYIDTGVKPSNDLRTKFRAAYTHTPIENNSTIFGSRSTASSNDRYWLNYDSKFEVGYGSYYNTGVTVSPGEMFDVDFNYIENGDHKFKINDSVFTYSGTPNTTIGIILFGRIVGAQVTRCSSRFYSAQFFRNGVLVRDFIPVRKGTVGYLYDRVSGKLFGNAGTGAFSYGSDVVQVEWLETSGTQYVDTGVVPGPGLDYSISFAFTSMSSYSYIMGAWSSNNSNYYDLAEQSNTLIYAGLGTTQKAIANVPVGVFSTAEKRGLEIYIDGVKKNTFPADVQSGSISSTILLFGVHRNYGPGYIVASQPLRVSKYSLTLNGTDIRKFLPVRVGTEGAMMDTLTRRIYRNAGTGAFTYGNDLKNPIPA